MSHLGHEKNGPRQSEYDPEKKEKVVESIHARTFQIIQKGISEHAAGEEKDSVIDNHNRSEQFVRLWSDFADFFVQQPNLFKYGKKKDLINKIK